MNRFSSILLVSFVFILGFLLRGCAENEVANEQAASVVTVQDTSQNGVLLIARDSVHDLTAEIEALKKAINKAGQPSKVVVYVTERDTIRSSVSIASTPRVVKIRDTTYVDSSRLAMHTFDFKDSFLFARVNVNGQSASIDSLGIFNEMRMVVSEMPISKYTSQKIVLFSPTNPYVSSYSHGYTEMPRYTDLGISNLKKKEKRKGVLWGVLSTAAAATTYFILKK
jgi:vacuolar-type H+-ATPase subunit F/Vma7